MKLSTVAFPVYRLGNHPPNKDGDVSFYYRHSIYNNIEKHSIRILDDRSVPGDKLATRRLRIAATGAKLYKLSTAIFFPSDLLKLSNPKTWFIDSSGVVFNYIKTTSVPLLFKKIVSVSRVPGASLIEVEGLPGRYMCLYPPTPEDKYAGVLQLSNSAYLLYGLYTNKHKDTHRKI